MKKCDQELCPNQATHRYTWPGHDDTFVCTEHLPEEVVLEPMVHVIEIPPDDE